MRQYVLDRLQSAVESLHGSVADLDVNEYVVGPEIWRCLPGAKDGMVEQLFVRHDPDDGEVQLALYIAPEVVDTLRRDDPLDHLHGGNLESFWVALEGVSHFVMVAWRARAGRPVSALELELQAEVDKFVAAWLLLARQGAALESTGRQLLRQLFDKYVLHEAVGAEEADRYHVASRVAYSFCTTLVARFARERSPRTPVEKAVRRFVRMDMAEKLRAA